MTMNSFLDSDVFSGREAVLSATTEHLSTTLRQHRSTTRVSRISPRLLRTAMAATAVAALTMPVTSITATRAAIRVHTELAAAAVKAPSLSASQIRRARFMQGAFERIDPDRDATGEDPDYGF